MTRAEHDRARVERQLQYAATLLRPGECVLWSGRPSVRVVVRRVLPQSIFGVVFVCMLVFMIGMTARRVGFFESSRAAPGSAVAPWIVYPMLAMMGVVVVLLVSTGLALSASAWRARRSAERTLYVLTDHRALVLRENSFGQECVREFLLGDPERFVAFHTEGIGTIAFDRAYAPVLWSMRLAAPDWFVEGFVGIADGVEVEKLIRDPALRATARNRVGASSASDQRVEKGPLSA